MRVLLLGTVVPLLLLLVILMPPTASGTVPPSDYSAGIKKGEVAVSINLNMFQNLTVLQPSFALPQFHSLVSDANASSIAVEVQKALDSKRPRSQVSALRLEAASSPWSDITSLQWLNVSMSFNVIGAQTGSGDARQVDVSWKSFAVPTDITLSGFEVNNIGAKYLVQPARDIVAQKPLPFVRLSFRVNGIAVAPGNLPIATLGIRALNFSSLAPKVSAWPMKYDFDRGIVAWSFADPHVLGIIVSELVQEPGGASNVVYGLFYSLKAMITAPRRSSVSGDSITTSFGDSSETLMGITVVLSVVLGSVVFAYERRILNRGPKRWSKR